MFNMTIRLEKICALVDKIGFKITLNNEYTYFGEKTS